ncbi:MAG: hypothetical protein V1655_03015 [bacterium]
MRRCLTPKGCTISTDTNYPDKIIFQLERIKAVKIFKRKNKKYLCVVIYEKMNGVKRIITAFITSKINKYI